MNRADRMTESRRAASTEVLNPRRVLTRAPSSDLAFLHAALEVTQKLVQQTGSVHSSDGVARVLETRVSGSGTHRIRVDCVQCESPPRRVSASPDGWVVEHWASGRVSIFRNGAMMAARLDGASDVRCSWWLSDCVVGVVAAAPAADALWVYAIDDSGDAQRTELAMPARGKVGPVAAQGSVVVCADAATGALSFWDLEVVRGGGRTGLGVVRSGCIESAPEAQVVHLRWVTDGVGLAATQAGAFWFDVRKEAGSRGCAPLSWLQGGRRLVAGVAAATVVTWRWKETVVAVVAGTGFPPRSAALCLPSASSMTFYDIGEPRADGGEAGRQQQQQQYMRKFEAGWAWLCGSEKAYAVLSSSRQMATVCRMPGGEPLYTLETRDGAIIMDGWMMSVAGGGIACAISAGSMVYLLSFQD
ncbi:hypothetical protein IWW47_000937 [Coemansia sp. RSA 2052]|nr:hypothetical protein IWW47_000937 [Coemansia sp. RSA 2052]